MSEAPAATAHRPAWAPWTLAAFVALVAASNVAAFTFSKVLTFSPEALLALSSRNRFLALALGADVSAWGYWLVAPLRLAVAYAVCHLIGRAYADVVLKWFIKYLGATQESIDQLNAGFGTAENVLIPIFVGSNLVAAMTGIHRTPTRKLVVLVTLGIYLRLALIWVLAWFFEPQLNAVVDWIQRWSGWVLIGSLVLVVLANGRNLQRGSAD